MRFPPCLRLHSSNLIKNSADCHMISGNTTFSHYTISIFVIFRVVVYESLKLLQKLPTIIRELSRKLKIFWLKRLKRLLTVNLKFVNVNLHKQNPRFP